MEKLETFLMMTFLALIAAGLIGFSAYSDYSVCRTYYSEMNPFLCMVSKKTVALPERK